MNRDEAALAGGMLRIAIQRMARQHPFYAHLLSASRLTCDPDVGTMGVTIREGRILFLYAPAFVVGCTYDELIGVFQHEINHILFGHVLSDPEDYPDVQARVIAEEVTANEWVRAPLPGRPLTLEEFPALKPLEDTQTRYDYLARNRPEPGRKTVPSGRKTDSSGPKSSPQARKSAPEGVKLWPVHRENDDLAPLDNHDLWGEARENRVLGELIVASAVRAARRDMDDGQWQAVPAELQQRIEELTAGQSPGSATEPLPGTGSNGLVDWRMQLRRYLARIAMPHPTFGRPPRRMPELIGVLPAQCRRALKPMVMAVLDTSASMGPDLLGIIEGELKRLVRDHQVTVVECDAAIQACYPYRGSLSMVHGRGGTDLRPPFEPQFLAAIRPDVIVYFTDGAGPAPEHPPPVSVIWCLMPGGVSPSSWGRQIRIPEP